MRGRNDEETKGQKKEREEEPVRGVRAGMTWGKEATAQTPVVG